MFEWTSVLFVSGESFHWDDLARFSWLNSLSLPTWSDCTVDRGWLYVGCRQRQCHPKSRSNVKCTTITLASDEGRRRWRIYWSATHSMAGTVVSLNGDRYAKPPRYCIRQSWRKSEINGQEIHVETSNQPKTVRTRWQTDKWSGFLFYGELKESKYQSRAELGRAELGRAEQSRSG